MLLCLALTPGSRPLSGLSRATLDLADRAIGRVWVTSAGRASALMESEIERAADGRVCAHALQTVAFVDLKSGRPTRVPPEFRQAMT